MEEVKAGNISIDEALSRIKAHHDEETKSKRGIFPSQVEQVFSKTKALKRDLQSTLLDPLCEPSTCCAGEHSKTPWWEANNLATKAELHENCTETFELGCEAMSNETTAHGFDRIFEIGWSNPPPPPPP